MSRKTLGGAMLAAALLGACASDAPAPRSLVLQAQPLEVLATLPRLSASVVVDRVILPDYVKRNPLLERIAPGELNYRDSARWAEPLGEALPRVLADDLSALLGRSVTLTKLRPQANAADPAWLLWVDVRRLEADAQGQVLLEAHWSWLREGQGEKPWQHGVFQAQASSRDPERIALAHSQVLAELARAVAGGLAQAR
ncbi:putative lipoprotein YmbA [Paucibacter oligotrophus]|uniref:Putative lipoprotein YmbA n=1 Tax=Roseateles oligotrophus TaxID=1769250 RepID=A0A840LJU1_9BURK|nr:PqiC family protein [Roseateles oligotrophus]MBB4846249.1 putative lipoprotein YmbA [Roseateles oligotrophus]